MYRAGGDPQHHKSTTMHPPQRETHESQIGIKIIIIKRFGRSGKFFPLLWSLGSLGPPKMSVLVKMALALAILIHVITVTLVAVKLRCYSRNEWIVCGPSKRHDGCSSNSPSSFFNGNPLEQMLSKCLYRSY